MLMSIAAIIQIGMGSAWFCRKLRLPGLLGMIVTGIVLGPGVLNWIDSSILNISAELILLAPPLLRISVLDAAILGAVVSAVSPAVIVPKMLKLMEEGYGTSNSIPQMILAGASVDDVFVLVGATVDMRYVFQAGGAFVLLIFAVLLF